MRSTSNNLNILLYFAGGNHAIGKKLFALQQIAGTIERGVEFYGEEETKYNGTEKIALKDKGGYDRVNV